MRRFQWICLLRCRCSWAASPSRSRAASRHGIGRTTVAPVSLPPPPAQEPRRTSTLPARHTMSPKAYVKDIMNSHDDAGGVRRVERRRDRPTDQAVSRVPAEDATMTGTRSSRAAKRCSSRPRTC